MNVERIVDDYKLVQSEWMRRQCTNSDSIAAFFGDNKQMDLFYEVADTHGELALNEYTEFVANTYFPMDGSWIGISVDTTDKEAIAESVKVREVINEELINSRFYAYMTDMIRNGACYRNSILNITNVNGLNFDIIENNEISLSYEKGEGRKRAYGETCYTVLELIQNFEGEIINELAALTGYNTEEPNQGELIMQKSIIIALVPKSEFFGTSKIKERYKYVKLYFLLEGGEYHLITNKKEGQTGFYTFPLLNYHARGKRSLAETALTSAIMANKFTMQKNERIDIENNPILILDKSTIAENMYSTGARGLIGTSANEVQPSAVPLTGSSSLVLDDIQAAHAEIDRIFKIDIIKRAQITSVSNFEAAELMLNAIDATALNCSDIINVSNDALRRACDILATTIKDSSKKKLLKKFKNSLYSVGLQVKREKLQRISKLGRFVQTFAPYAQMKPSATQTIAADNVAIALADALGLPQVLASEEDIQRERQATAQAQQMQQQQQAQESQAKLLSAQQTQEGQ